MKRFLMLLALSLLLACALPALAEEAVYAHLGEPMPDFTVTTIAGETLTLSEVLKEKDMVLVNLWATWCGPCGMEFPYMQQAYEEYRDRVEIIALSVEPADTDEKLTAYAREKGMTFPVANGADTGLGETFATVGIPTTIAVDRFGNIGFITIGARTSAREFARMFDAFLGADYTQTQVYTQLPSGAPAADPDAGALNAALNGEGGSLSFRCAGDGVTWPMLPEDGAARSSNAGESGSAAAVLTALTAGEGDALAFRFAASTRALHDLLRVQIDGETVKAFGGEHPWTDWAIPLPPGEHEIAFRYEKGEYGGAGEDCVWLDDVRLLSGDAAAAALAALPVRPTAEEISLTPVNEGARQIVFDGQGAMMLQAYFGSRAYWILPEDTADVLLRITPDIEPEAAFAFSDYDRGMTPLTDALDAERGGYLVTTAIDSVDTTGYSYTVLYLYPSVNADSVDQIYGVMLFAGEENAEAFVSTMQSEAELNLTWREAEPAPEAAATPGSYRVIFTDQAGQPVPGCIVNFCTEEMCVPAVADENGVATFTGEPYAYHLQVIRVPEGYSFDTAQEFTADPNGGEVRFTVNKN